MKFPLSNPGRGNVTELLVAYDGGEYTTQAGETITEVELDVPEGVTQLTVLRRVLRNGRRIADGESVVVDVAGEVSVDVSPDGKLNEVVLKATLARELAEEVLERLEEKDAEDAEDAEDTEDEDTEDEDEDEDEDSYEDGEK